MATTETRDIRQEPWYERLLLPSYRISEAARYVGAHPRSVSAWHARDNTVVPPHKSRDGLSYLQLVEFAFVTALRDAGISIQLIRAARQYLSEEFDFVHPLAHSRFKVSGPGVLGNFFGAYSVEHKGNRIAAWACIDAGWRERIKEKADEFDYQYELALRWYPAGRESQVVIDPRHRWGWPMVQGLETWAIKGSYDAGETIEGIAEDYAVTIAGVLDALRFEGVSEAALA